MVLAYYWGLSLNLMAVLTPDLTYTVNPVVEFTLFWFSHGAALTTFAVLAVVWVLMTWPWVTASAREHSRPPRAPRGSARRGS